MHQNVSPDLRAKEPILLVISPLLALMQDQVKKLKSVGLKAAYVMWAQWRAKWCPAVVQWHYNQGSRFCHEELCKISKMSQKIFAWTVCCASFSVRFSSWAHVLWQLCWFLQMSRWLLQYNDLHLPTLQDDTDTGHSREISCEQMSKLKDSWKSWDDNLWETPVTHLNRRVRHLVVVAQNFWNRASSTSYSKCKSHFLSH